MRKTTLSVVPGGVSRSQSITDNVAPARDDVVSSDGETDQLATLGCRKGSIQ